MNFLLMGRCAFETSRFAACAVNLSAEVVCHGSSFLTAPGKRETVEVENLHSANARFMEYKVYFRIT